MRTARQVFPIPFIISILALVSIPIYAQPEFRADLETGYYRSSTTTILKKDNLLNCLDGLIGYNFRDDTRSANVKLRVRPEFYGFNNRLRTLKLRTEGIYYQSEESFGWGFNLSRQLYNFTGREIDLDYDTFNITLNGDWNLMPGFPLSASAGYCSQEINNGGGNELNQYIIEMLSENRTGEFSKIVYGLYTEKFDISGNADNLSSNQTAENNGWRYGPVVVFNYLHDSILNVEYRLLFLNSKLTKSISYEQLVRFIAGKLLYENWSIFILADMYFRKFRLNTEGGDNINLFYNPINIDDRIYIKVSYEISEYIEIYIRSGYLKENLINSNYSYSGWNALIGIELGN